MTSGRPRRKRPGLPGGPGRRELAGSATISAAALELVLASGRAVSWRAQPRTGPERLPDMTRRCHVSWLAAVLTLATSCASVEVRRDVHEAGWLLVETEHIELRTDLDPEDAARRARQLEQYWRALAAMYGAVAPGRPPPGGRFAVIHFDRCRDLTRFQRRSWSAFVFLAPSWRSQPVAVTCEGNGDSLLIHELAHIFNDHHVPGMPVWLNEGLATYYETLTVRNGKAIIGFVPRERVGACRGGIPPGLDEIRRMSFEAFHEGQDESCHYLAAWKLVHLLTGTTTDRMRRFHRYLDGLRRTLTSDQAWSAAFGDLPAGLLSDDYDRYARRRIGTGWSAPHQLAEPPRPRMRSLRPAEAHVLWIVMLRYRGERELARQQLDRMAEAVPDSPELLYWRAVLLASAAGVPFLREYLARLPEDERAWWLLIGLQIDAATPTDYMGLDRRPPAGLRAIEPDVLQLIARARDASSLNLIGWYYALRQEPVAGLPYAVQSVKKEPRCGACWDTVALLFFQAGRVESALEAQERAVNLMAENAGSGVLVRLRRYRAAAAAASRAGRRPSPPPR